MATIASPSAEIPPANLKTSDYNTEYDVHWDQVLGKGNRTTGVVVACTRKSDGLRCAFKCVPYDLKSVREVQLQQFCSRHPNIVKIIDAFDNIAAKGPADFSAPIRRIFIVLELMEGGELFDRIIASHHFDEHGARIVMKQMATAVKFLHSNNIAHRDLKPENFLYKTRDANSILKLADFGFAKVDRGDLETPAYTKGYVAKDVIISKAIKDKKAAGMIGPEVKHTYDRSVDLWSLGVILYVLLCGKLPFETLELTKEGRVTFTGSRWSSISQDAIALVQHLIHSNPIERMTANELCQDKWLCAEDTPESYSPLVTPTATPQDMKSLSIQIDASLNQMRSKDSITLNPIPEFKKKGIKKTETKQPSRFVFPSPGSSAPPDVTYLGTNKLASPCLLPPPFTPPASFVRPPVAFYKLIKLVHSGSCSLTDLNSAIAEALLEQHSHGIFFAALISLGWRRVEGFTAPPSFLALYNSLLSLAKMFIPGFQESDAF